MIKREISIPKISGRHEKERLKTTDTDDSQIGTLIILYSRELCVNQLTA
jgi:hypothetical protein